MTIQVNATKYLSEDMSSPAVYAFLAAKSDTVDLEQTTKAILVTVAGTYRVTLAAMSASDTIDLPLPIGYNPLQVKRIHSTGSNVAAVYGLV